MPSLRTFKVLVFAVCLLPFVWLTYAFFTYQLGANPIEAVTRETGQWALRFVMISLAVSPLKWLTDFSVLLRFRRMLGLFAYFYASVHMLLYLGLDQFFDFSEIWVDIIKRPFITIGFLTFVLLTPLTITSTNKMIKRLGRRRWKMLHQLNYLIVILACVHFFMLVKQDKTEPIIYFMIAAVLLLSRVFYRARQLSSSHA